MLQVSPEKIAVPLRIFFSKSLEQCKYPKSWKKANIIPIFKKGNNSYPSNYRSISLISCEFQSGFLPKHSTVHQLLEMYKSILNSLERKEMSCFFSFVIF